MCDIVYGEILFSHHVHDTVAYSIARMGRDFGWPVVYRENLNDKLARVGGTMNPALNLTVHRLGVPIGDEIWWISELLREYFVRTAQHGQPNPAYIKLLAAGPNHWLDTSQASTRTQYNFQFGANHSRYKSMINESQSPATGTGVRVKIIDTGISSSSTIPTGKIVKRMNLLDPQNPQDVEDETGHGTAVAEIIYNVAPDAELLVYKVKRTGRIVEWDMLAALSDAEAAPVTNLSVAFGLNTANCSNCGRQSHSSRSAVFETLIKQILESNNQNIVVAAAGNRGSSTLAYPARFGDVLALGSVDSGASVSSFSNYGAVNQIQQTHDKLFFAPGGAAAPGGAVSEEVGTVNPGNITLTGTSFSTAYASGLLAKMNSDSNWQGSRADQLLDDLRTYASATVSTSIQIVNYNKTDHGNGLLQLR